MRLCVVTIFFSQTSCVSTDTSQIISHNHYDHCDLPTLKDVYRKHTSRPPYLFIPLANRHTLKGTVPEDRIIEMDWWDERVIEVEGKGKAKVTCSEYSYWHLRAALQTANVIQHRASTFVPGRHSTRITRCGARGRSRGWTRKAKSRDRYVASSITRLLLS